MPNSVPSSVPIAFAASTVAASTVNTSSSVSLPAKKEGGKVFVQADAFVQMFGGSGTYDAKTNSFRYIPNDVSTVVQKVGPSVVAIIGRDKEAEESENPLEMLSHGTGVIVKADGWIVTNAHVITSLKKPVVVTPDGKTHAVKKFFADELSDIALVKIDTKGLKPATFVRADGALKVGEPVVAIGTPVSFNLRNSATAGVISGLDRALESSYKLIQTDAAINPGNSGGPLVNMKGEVVGINTMKYSAIGIENMGFTVPADTVTLAVQHFFKFGKVKRASIGAELEESWEAFVGLPTKDAVKVSEVVSASAKKAGLKKGDVLVAINGKKMNNLVDVVESLKTVLPGKQVKLTMLSRGKVVSRVVTLTDEPKQEAVE
ncbi:trypsin-like peptidase domain-containing protein [Paenibacillus sp. 481]|nr:trypsin-like peptidase domain-containing protein [Paenibacillus sp. 481]